MFNFKKLFKHFYWSLFFITIIITLIGIVFIYAACYTTSAQATNYAFKQFVWSLIGLGVLLTIVAVGYRSFLNLSFVLYVVSLILLILVYFIGKGKYGAQRWLYIGGFVLQPSEFCKLSLILMLSHYLGSRERNLYQKKRFVNAFIITFIPLLLIIKQPDLGTALIFLPILFSMLFLWGAKIKYMLITIFFGISSLPFVWHVLKDYQKRRLLTFININADPLGSGYTAIQSKIAVGSGGFIGKGLLCGTQNRLNFVPEHHTDFIFCVIAEEGGFLAACSLVLMFAVLLALAISVINKTTHREAKLLATGITVMLFFQIVINIGMTIGLCPITGLPLPFISYGGSSLLTYFTAIGLLISIYKERSIF